MKNHIPLLTARLSFHKSKSNLKACTAVASNLLHFNALHRGKRILHRLRSDCLICRNNVHLFKKSRLKVKTKIYPFVKESYHTEYNNNRTANCTRQERLAKMKYLLHISNLDR